MTELGAAVAIQTARLILRSPLPEDAKVIARLANSPAVAKETFALPHPFSSDDARAWINGRDGHRFVVENRDSGQLFGCIEIFQHDEDWELGLWLGRAHWNQGIGTEALAALGPHALIDLGLKRLTAPVFAEHGAGLRLLEKAGFARVGERIDYLEHRGGKRNVVWFVLGLEHLPARAS